VNPDGHKQKHTLPLRVGVPPFIHEYPKHGSRGVVVVVVVVVCGILHCSQ
jgi:hypothetical protein